MSETAAVWPTPHGHAVLVDPYGTLNDQCAAAGLTGRQTQVLLSVARGRSNAEISAALGISEGAVAQAIVAGTRKLEDAFGEVRGMSGLEARDLLECMFKRSCSKPREVVYDRNGRVVGAKAKAFGMLPEDITRRPKGTQVLLELVCRLQGVGVPTVRPRVREVPVQRHPADCRCRKCAAQSERELAAGAKNRRERRALKFAGLRPV